jgi:hypothetical protein
LCDGKAFDFVPVYHQRVVFSGSGGFFTVDLALESALRRVVFYKICQVIRRNEVIYRSNLVALLEESLLNHRAKEKSPDASEAIDADCSHFMCSSCLVSERGGVDLL